MELPQTNEINRMAHSPRHDFQKTKTDPVLEDTPGVVLNCGKSYNNLGEFVRVCLWPVGFHMVDFACSFVDLCP